MELPDYLAWLSEHPTPLSAARRGLPPGAGDLSAQDLELLATRDIDLIWERCKPAPPGGWDGWRPRRGGPDPSPGGSSSRDGSLVFVGTGISFGQMTLEARAQIQHADVVLHIGLDPVTEAWVVAHASESESLARFYGMSKERSQSYAEMTDRILSQVRAGRQVCCAFYGHPGVFVNSSHDALAIARSEGFEARMLPGVSAEDCLFADLGVDPGRGCQSHEANRFLIRRPDFDPHSALILWQIGVLGHTDYHAFSYALPELSELLEVLLLRYPGTHEVALYEAAQFAICDPRVAWVPLDHLTEDLVDPIHTLYVPPLSRGHDN